MKFIIKGKSRWVGGQADRVFDRVFDMLSGRLVGRVVDRLDGSSTRVRIEPVRRLGPLLDACRLTKPVRSVSPSFSVSSFQDRLSGD